MSGPRADGDQAFRPRTEEMDIRHEVMAELAAAFGVDAESSPTVLPEPVITGSSARAGSAGAGSAGSGSARS